LLAFERNAYWAGDPNRDVGDIGPYCSRCFDVEGKAVRMHKTPYTGHAGSIYVCPECGKANSQS
jgi:hypothetical protein